MSEQPSIGPLYTHDCDSCFFLGRFQHQGLLFTGERKTYELDLYVCRAPSVLGPTYIARRSSEGPDYSSMARDILEPDLQRLTCTLESTFDPAVFEAHRRANSEQHEKLFKLGWRARSNSKEHYFTLSQLEAGGWQSFPLNETDRELWTALAQQEGTEEKE